jgi:hypothetical protein
VNARWKKRLDRGGDQQRIEFVRIEIPPQMEIANFWLQMLLSE